MSNGQGNGDPIPQDGGDGGNQNNDPNQVQGDGVNNGQQNNDQQQQQQAQADQGDIQSIQARMEQMQRELQKLKQEQEEAKKLRERQKAEEEEARRQREQEEEEEKRKKENGDDMKQQKDQERQEKREKAKQLQAELDKQQNEIKEKAEKEKADKLKANKEKLEKEKQEKEKFEKEQEEKKKQGFKSRVIASSPRGNAQSIKELKMMKKQLKEEVSNIKQGNAPKIVYTILNPNTDKKDVKNMQKELDRHSKSELSQSSSSIDSKKLAPLVVAQNLKRGQFKDLNEIQQAQKLFQSTPILGVALKRGKAKTDEQQEVLDILNHYTDKEFDTNPSHLSFENIDAQVVRNTQFLIIHIEDIIYTDVKDLRVNTKLELKQTSNPALYYWQVLQQQRPLTRTSVKPFGNITFECLDVLFKNNFMSPLEVVLTKSQGRNNLNIGQFNIEPKEFEQFEEIKTINKKIVKLRKSTTQLLFRNPGEAPLKGTVTIKYKLIQYSQAIEPQNTISNVVGSPRTLDERARRKLVEDSKFSDYAWREDERNTELVIIIQNAAGEIVIITTEEGVKEDMEARGIMGLLMGDGNIKANGGPMAKYPIARRVQATPQVMALIKSIEQDPNKTVFGNLKVTISKGRVPKKDLQAALQSMGCDPVNIFVDKKDEMGQCEMDTMLGDCNFGAVLDVVVELDLTNVKNEAQLEEFADSVFRCFKDQLKSNARLQPTVEFIKQAANIPDIGMVVAKFAIQFTYPQPPMFIEYLDINNNNMNVMDNYEHVMMLGKLIKLSKKYLPPEQKFMKTMQDAYDSSKLSVYFSVPVLPKKMNLQAKKHLLVLGGYTDIDDLVTFEVVEEGNGKKKYKRVPKPEKEKEENPGEPQCVWNVFHECVRRKRWNMVYRGFAFGPEFFYQKDISGHTPLMNLIEQAPYDVVMSILMDQPIDEPKKQDDKKDDEKKQDDKKQDEPKQDDKKDDKKKDDKKDDKLKRDDDDKQDGPPRPPIKVDPIKVIAMKTKNNKNIMHALASNSSPDVVGQLKALQRLQEILPKDKMDDMLMESIKIIDILPLTMYINRLARNDSSFSPLDSDNVKEIIKILSAPLNKILHPTEYRSVAFVRQQSPATFKRSQGKLQFINSEDNLFPFPAAPEFYYTNHVQVTRAMAQLQPNMFEFVSDALPWIDWFALNIQNYNNLYNQFAIYNLARQGKFAQIEKILKKFEAAQPTLPNTLFKDPTIQLKDKNCVIKIDGLKYQILDKTDTAIYTMESKELIEKVGQYFSKYPVDQLIGILQEFKSYDYQDIATINYIKGLITKLVKESPIVLCKQLTMHDNIGEVMRKVGLQSVMDTLPAYIKEQMVVPNADSKILAELESREYGNADLILNNMEKLFKDDKIDLVLEYLANAPKGEKEIEKVEFLRLDTLKRIMKSTLSKLPESTGGAKLSKIITTLKKSPLLKSTYMASGPFAKSMIAKNYNVMNHLLLLSGYPQFQFHGLIIQQNELLSCPGVQNYTKAAYTHYAMALNTKQFKQLLEDTKDCITMEDYNFSSQILAQNGMHEKLSLIISKIKKPDIIASMLRDSLVIGAKLLQLTTNKVQFKYGKYPLLKSGMSNQIFNEVDTTNTQKIPQQTYPRIERPYVVVTKNVPILSKFALFDYGVVTSLLASASRIFENSNNIPRSCLGMEKLAMKPIHQQYMDQMLRRTFLTQNVGGAFSTWVPDNQNYQKSIDLIVKALPIAKVDEAIALNPAVTNMLKKSHILPLFTDNVAMMLKSTKPKVATLKAIDNLVQYHCKIKPSKDFQYQQKIRESRSLKFIREQFTPNLSDIFQEQKMKLRLLRIIRTIDFTLKRVKAKEPIEFAVQVVLIIGSSFQQNDFAMIAGSDNLFNALSVAMIRSKTMNPQALEFIGKYVNNYKFYDLVHSIGAEEKNEKKRVDVFPESIEVADAEVILTISKANNDYIITLLKNKAKPLQKSMELKNRLVTKHFGIGDSIKEVSLLEYLIIQDQEQLLKKYYLKVLKPKNAQTQEQNLKWIFLACCSGNYAIFEMVLRDIVNISLNQLLQLAKQVPIYNQFISKANETQAILFTKNIIYQNELTDVEFKDILGFGKENGNALITIIQKHYGQLYQYIQTYVLEKICKQDQAKYTKIVEYLVNYETEEAQIKDEDDNTVQLSILEYSLSLNMIDICLSLGDAKLARNPFKNPQFEMIKEGILNCGNELRIDEAILLKSQDKLRVRQIKLYFAMKQYIGYYSKQTDLKGVSWLRLVLSSIILFPFLKEYYKAECRLYRQEITQLFLLGTKIENIGYHANYEYLKGAKKLDNTILFSLQMCGIQSIMKYKMSVFDYFNTYYKDMKLIWTDSTVLKVLKDEFKTDVVAGFHKTADITKLMPEIMDSGDKIVKMFFFLNDDQLLLQEDIAINCINQQQIPISQTLVYLRARQAVNMTSLIGMIDYPPIQKLNGVFIVSMLTFCILDSNTYTKPINYILKVKDPSPKGEVNPINPVLSIFKALLIEQQDTLSILSMQLTTVINSLQSNKVYTLTKPLNKSIHNDKLYLEGLLAVLDWQTNDDRIQLNYDKKQLLKYFTFENHKVDPLQADKVYRGLQLAKFVIDFIMEVHSLKYDDATIIVEPTFYMAAQGKNQLVSMIKIVQVKKNQEITGYKYHISVPFLQTETRGYTYFSLQPHFIKQAHQLINKHKFETVALPNLLASAVQVSKVISEATIFQTILAANVTMDNIEVLQENSENAFKLGVGMDDFQVSFLLGPENFEEGESNLFPRGVVMKFEDEAIVAPYFETPHNVEVSMVVVTKDQFAKRSLCSMQLDKLIKDIGAFNKFITNQSKDKKQANLELTKKMEWLFYIDSKNEIVTDNYNYPQHTYLAIISYMDEWCDSKYLLNYYSFIDAYFNKMAQMMEVNYKSTMQVDMRHVVYYSLQWQLLEYIMDAILNEVKSTTSNVIFEMKEGFQKPFPELSLEGYDGVLRLGATNYYYHRKFIVVRLNVVYIRAHLGESVLNKSVKQLQKPKISGDIQPYIDSILNFKDLSKLLEEYGSAF